MRLETPMSVVYRFVAGTLLLVVVYTVAQSTGQSTRETRVNAVSSAIRIGDAAWAITALDGIDVAMIPERQRKLNGWLLLAVGTTKDARLAFRLVSLGADVNCIGTSGFTPSHTAAYASNASVLRELKKLGADVNHRDSEGRTPIYICVENSDLRTTLALLELGADASIPDHQGITPLMLAMKHDDAAIKSVLEQTR